MTTGQPDSILKPSELTALVTNKLNSNRIHSSLSPLRLLLHFSTPPKLSKKSTMGLQPFLIILMMMLTITHHSNCRDIRRIIAQETEQIFKESEIFPPQEWSNDEEVDPIYGASDRSVPGGPNPLHN